MSIQSRAHSEFLKTNVLSFWSWLFFISLGKFHNQKQLIKLIHFRRGIIVVGFLSVTTAAFFIKGFVSDSVKTVEVRLEMKTAEKSKPAGSEFELMPNALFR